MHLHAVLFLGLLAWAQLLRANKQLYKIRDNFWKSSAPGELLNELDLIARDELHDRRYLKPVTNVENESTTVEPIKKRIATKEQKHRNKNPRKTKKPAVRRIASSEDGSVASTSASTEQLDYDRTYEQFVNRYFNNAADHYLEDNDKSDEFVDASASHDADNLSGSIETIQPFDTTSKASKNPKKSCRKLRKNGEVCFICKSPRTNEQSESCSYEHSSEPKSYAFETQRTFRKSRDRKDNGDAGNDSTEYAAESKLLPQTVSQFEPSNDTHSNEFEANSTCSKRAAGGKSCYYCRNKLGDLQINCFTSEGDHELEKLSENKPLNKDSHTKRRIFKRTLSYVFEKGHDSNGTLNEPTELQQNSTTNLN